MAHIRKKALALLLALLLVPAFSGCGDSTQGKAERCLEALSKVNSAGSLYAVTEVTMENGGEPETVNQQEYWRNGADILYTAFSDDEFGGKLWQLYYDGIWYTKYTYEVPNEEADTWGHDWEAGGSPTSIAFWEGIPQKAEDLTFVSEDAGENTSVLTFQAALTDGDTQPSSGARLDKVLHIFTLDGNGNLLEVETRLSYVEDTDGAENKETFIYHADFVDTGAARELIEAEAELAGAIG